VSGLYRKLVAQLSEINKRIMTINRGYIHRVWPTRYPTGDQFVGYFEELEQMAIHSMLSFIKTPLPSSIS